MRFRLIKSLHAPVVGTLLLTLGSGTSLQAAEVPDLTGTYDLATLTPLQRPVAWQQQILKP